MASNLKGLIVRVSIDKLVLSSSTRGSNPFLKGDLPGYNFEDNWKTGGTSKSKLKGKYTKSDGDKRCDNYRWKSLYLAEKSRNRLIICNGRRRPIKSLVKNKYIALPSMIVSFSGSYVYHSVQALIDPQLNYKLF